MARRRRQDQPQSGGAAPQSSDRGEADAAVPWRIRFAEEILTEDLAAIGHAALEMARSVIEKKLKVAPEQYGARLHRPLHGLWKIKTSHVRIVYHIEAALREVWVLMIGARRDIWNDDQDTILERLQSLQSSSEESDQTQ